jgi:hypothetical protein
MKRGRYSISGSGLEYKVWSSRLLLDFTDFFTSGCDGESVAGLFGVSFCAIFCLKDFILYELWGGELLGCDMRYEIIFICNWDMRCRIRRLEMNKGGMH